jgi:hypothetical protein
MALESVVVGRVSFGSADIQDLIGKYGKALEENHKLRETIKQLEHRACQCHEESFELAEVISTGQSYCRGGN